MRFAILGRFHASNPSRRSPEAMWRTGVAYFTPAFTQSRSRKRAGARTGARAGARARASESGRVRAGARACVCEHPETCTLCACCFLAVADVAPSLVRGAMTSRRLALRAPPSVGGPRREGHAPTVRRGGRHRIRAGGRGGRPFRRYRPILAPRQVLTAQLFGVRRRASGVTAVRMHSLGLGASMRVRGARERAHACEHAHACGMSVGLVGM